MTPFLKKTMLIAWTFAMAGASYATDYNASLLEGIYPGLAASQSAFNYNARTFFVQGKPTYLYIGEMHYARVPRELWRDRLMRMKRAGYNTVSSYVFWNAHEPVRGQFHFERNLDLDAWLSVIDSLGMYAILRVGPYCCAEWDAGGFAPWLAGISGMNYRSLNGPFFSYVKPYWQQLFPKFVSHQIHKGGPLIALQIENEIMRTDQAYKDSLCNLARSLGLEVPYIYSQIMNSGEPSVEFNTHGQFSTNGSFPWMTTEFWMGWFNLKGEPDPGQYANCLKGTWRFVALGSCGLSHYMIHGGTNFGYTASDDNQFTSYDYHAPIGEEGQFHKNYWVVKEAGLFFQAFQPVFATSTNGASLASLSNASTTSLTKYVHTTPSSGTIAVIENLSGGTASFKMTWSNKGITVPTTSAWSATAGKWSYFLADVPVTANATIDYSATGILTMKKIGTKNYLVLMGGRGTSGEIAFVYKTAPASPPAAPWTWNATAKRASLIFTYPPVDSVFEAVISEGAGQTLNVLIMDTTQAIQKTWVDDKFIATGAAYVDHNNMLQFSAAGGRAFVYSDSGKTVVVKAATTGQSAISLTSGWKWITASQEASPALDDSKWQTRSGYQDMASFGWPNGYGWYRATYNAASAGTATFAIVNNAIQDASYLFVNGVASGNTMTLKQGANTIAVLAVEYSRAKEYNYYGAPRNQDRSGIVDGISVNGTQVTGLKFKGGFDGIAESPLMGVISDSSWNLFMARTGWSTASAPSDNLSKFWRIDFNYTPPTNAKQTWDLNAPVVRAGRGVVWLNGQNIGRTIEGQWPMFIPECWLKNGANTLMVLTEDGKAPSNFQLTPIEYRSFANGYVSAVPAGRLTKTSFSNTSEFKVSGKRFVVPKSYAGKTVSVAVYNLSGRLLYTAVTHGPVVSMKKGIGVCIVRLKSIEGLSDR